MSTSIYLHRCHVKHLWNSMAFQRLKGQWPLLKEEPFLWVSQRSAWLFETKKSTMEIIMTTWKTASRLPVSPLWSSPPRGEGKMKKTEKPTERVVHCTCAQRPIMHWIERNYDEDYWIDVLSDVNSDGDQQRVTSWDVWRSQVRVYLLSLMTSTSTATRRTDAPAQIIVLLQVKNWQCSIQSLVKLFDVCGMCLIIFGSTFSTVTTRKHSSTSTQVFHAHTLISSIISWGILWRRKMMTREIRKIEKKNHNLAG